MSLLAPDSGEISGTPVGARLIEAVAFSAANSRAYLSAVFRAYREGRVVVALPRAPAIKTVPGVRILDRQVFTDDSGWFDETLEPIHGDAAAQISFSSGTTGRPKPLLLSHRALTDVVERINAAMEVTGEIREYVGVPVTFSFGFGRVRAVAAAGGRSYLPAHGFDPAEIARMLKAGEINAISAVPTLWRVLLANPEIVGDAGARVRWVEIGSQYMSGDEKAAMKRLFPAAKIVQHYGLTEASRTALLDVSATAGPALDSVGRATGSVEIAISDEGAIRIRGPHLAEGLVSGAGVRPITDPDGWLTTADRGRIEDGLLYYEGRTDELINSGGVKIDPTQFEQRLGEATGVPEAVAVGRIADPLRGERVLVALRRDAGLDRAAVEKKAVEIAADYGLVGAGSLVVREVDEIPRTATGKVQRKALADVPDSTPAPAPAAAAPAGAGPAAERAAELQRVWAEVLGVSEVSLDESFYDLGGDSLSALTVIMRMEAMGLDPETARGIFDGRTIAEITGHDPAAAPAAVPAAPQLEVAKAPPVSPPPAAAAEAAPAPRLSLAQAMNAVHAARGVLVLWVVVVHWLPGVLARLPGSLDWVYGAMTPFLRFGTPGFAMVFGLGVGALGIPQFLRNRDAYLRGARFNAMLIIGGVLVLAFVRALAMWNAGRFDDPNRLSGMFYSAISYYALAVLAMPLILRLLTRWPDILLTIFATFAGTLLVHQTLAVTIAPLRFDGLPELLKILATAKYGFFRMTGYVMVGVAIGYLFRTHHNDPGLVRKLVVSGCTLAILGFLLAFEARPGAMFEDVGQVRPWHLMIYAGAATLILAGFCWLNRPGGEKLPRWLVVLNGFAIASGILALPIFVGHELVIPLKNLLVLWGLPGPLALLIPLAAFLGLLAWGYVRLLRFFLR
jgi:acyl-coenzyme A synthetase/AMP-(fatty) acid ligase